MKELRFGLSKLISNGLWGWLTIFGFGNDKAEHLICIQEPFLAAIASCGREAEV